MDASVVVPVGAVRLRWEAPYARRYRIQVPDDGSTWRGAYAASDAGTGTVDRPDGDRGRRDPRVVSARP